MTDLYQRMADERWAGKKRSLYAADPVWRLTKLKDNWERRERKRRGLA